MKLSKIPPLEWVSKADLESIFGDRLKWTGEIRKDDEEEAEDEKIQTGADMPMALLVDLSKLKERGNNEYQGSHPLHGSTTGNNFKVNIKKNLWHCFRCNSGGGALMFIAVKHGVIECNEAHRGALRGLKFIETVKFAKEDGFQLKVPDEEVSPDVNRFFEKDKFVPALVASELMRENHFLTQTTKGLMFRYNPSKGIYEPKAEDFINAETGKKLGKHYSIKRRAEIEAYIRAHTIKEIPETDNHLLAVKNGVLDILMRELKPFSHEYFIFNALPVGYDSNAKCPKFDKFLPEVVPPEKDRIVLQEHSGYCLLKDNRFQKALMLTGKKQNGKSTFLHVIEALLGKTNVSSIPLQLLSDSGFRFYVSQLWGKMANICADLPAEKLKETDTFKKIVAGDTVTGEFKFCPPFDFTPYAKLLYSANRLPELPKDVEAFLVRWDLVEFPNTFLPNDSRRDPQLKEKLTTPEELGGVLNWCLDGLQRLMKNEGFTKSDTLAEQEDRWIIEGDSVKAFVDRCTYTEFGAAMKCSDAYEAYVKFCKKHDVTSTPLKKFNRGFQEATKVDSFVTTFDKKSVRVWRAIGLKDEESEGDEGTD